MTTNADGCVPDWSSEQWQVRARSWVESQLSRNGRRVTGPVEPRLRPWSLVWRVPTDDGPVWFKANNRGTVHEAVLIATLAQLTPERRRGARLAGGAVRCQSASARLLTMIRPSRKSDRQCDRRRGTSKKPA
ncbi:hypothetical protein ACLQ28_03980 [Micromonospora sp. DT201]|uniref:hypothetical protein n=1 Tax=Micromonospora sp. DT201 TaxID=3393442 RepID=UPI003CF0400D